MRKFVSHYINGRRFLLGTDHDEYGQVRDWFAPIEVSEEPDGSLKVVNR